VPAPSVNNYQQEEPLVRQLSSAGAGRLGPTLPTRDSDRGGRNLSSYSGKLPSLEPAPSAPTIANTPLNVGGQQMFSPFAPSPKPSSPALAILLIGLVAFAIFFVVGYFLGHALIH
jgi:hypothetical protein